MSQDVWTKYIEGAGHVGGRRTVSQIRQHFFWPRMVEDVWGFHSWGTICCLQTVETRVPLSPTVVSREVEAVNKKHRQNHVHNTQTSSQVLGKPVW